MAVDGKGSISQPASGVSGANPSSPPSQAPPAPPIEADALAVSSAPSSPKPAAMAVDTSLAASGVSAADPSSSSPAPPAPPVEADALTISSDPSSSKPAAMAETEEDKVRDFRALTGISDNGRCAQILAASGCDLDLAVASVLADPSSTDAPPSSPLLAAPLAPDAYQAGGIAWKLMTAPFVVVGGGMDILLGTVRLSLWAIGRALSVMGLAWGTDQLLIKADYEDHVYAGDKARFLPSGILFDVACRLRKCRRDVQSMRAVCPQWRSAIPNTNGPWLVLSRRQLVLPPGRPRIAVLQMLKCAGAAAAAADVAMAVVPCLSLPPSSATCWGAAHGLVALRQLGTNDLYLFCLICGTRRILPPPPDEMIPLGIFFNERPFEPMATLATNDQDGAIYTLRLHFELTDLQDAQRHRWAMYPGTDAHDMRSLCFDDCVHFIGATSADTVVIDEIGGGPRGHDMVFVNAPVVTDQVAWGRYGRHVFKCSGNIYLCLLFRDYVDVNVVSAQVFLLQPGYHLVRTNDIGSYAVYLGANKPVVLPAEVGSSMQRRNTIYVTDDDGVVTNGVVTNGRVISIDISSNEVSSIPFPDGVSIDEYGHASWVTAPPLDSTIWHEWHCNN